MAALSQISSSLCTSLPDVCVLNASRIHPVCRIPISNIARIGTSFASGSPLLIQGTSRQRTLKQKSGVISIRCEQGTKEAGGLDIWLGRFAMIGFAVAITVEVSTGKGLLENFGLTSPLPTVALGVTALIGVLTAIFIFQSSTDK
ncbi:hypothetical protein DCAR_0935781 [Daucus carota subsp. sativus]|uniref:Stress enhanced protein 1 n=1 Tax=Daucus carota subsp. sativus TaxID=79200 RepID=A0AAF0Y278_DAUCS|nr:PREDICTED: stress enhanced protein 1, chloroplastic [Daucus carota subsp. sativus]WOH16231.1 hypothetical protein DCAR_0935781 [Daucus carota subsp. sativus]